MHNNIPEQVWDTIYSFLRKAKGLHIKNENKTICFFGRCLVRITHRMSMAPASFLLWALAQDSQAI